MAVQKYIKDDGTAIDLSATTESLVSPATDAELGISRIATQSEFDTGKTGTNGPAFVTPELSKGLFFPQIMFVPQRPNALPSGLVYCNGLRFDNATWVAKALNSLSTQFKTDWGITDNGVTTNVPNWYHSDGRGPAMRAVNGTARQVGTVELDEQKAHAHTVSGAATGYNFGYVSAGGATYSYTASQTTSTVGGVETRMINRGMTPVIDLRFYIGDKV